RGPRFGELLEGRSGGLQGGQARPGIPQAGRHRGVFRWRAKAKRNHADDAASAVARDLRRDRFRPRHRRPARGVGWRPGPAQRRPLIYSGDPLPAPAELYRAGFRPRAGGRSHRQVRRQDPGPRTGGKGLRLAGRRGRLMAGFVEQALLREPEGTPAWLAARNRQGRDAGRGRVLPNFKVEAWKYTSLRVLEEGGFVAAPQAAASDEGLADHYRIDGLDAHRLVFVNGVYRPGLSAVALPEGVTLVPFSQA